MTVPAKLRVDAISAWAEQLPLANKSLVARETYELMERLPQSGLSARQQLQILEILKRPATLVLEHIRKRLMLGNAQTEQLLPLGDSYCERLSQLCESILNSEEDGKVKRLFGFKASASEQALALGNFFLEQWYLLRIVAHRPIPQGFWMTVREHAVRSNKAAMAPLARLLALHLTGPASLAPRQLQSLIELLQDLPMQGLLVVSPSTSADVGRQACVWPLGDQAPQFGWIEGEDSLQLDLQKLIEALRAGTKKPIDADLLALVMQRWDGVRPEKQGRTATARPIVTSVVVGLRGVVRHLGETTAASQAASGFSQEEVELSAGGKGFSETANPFARRSEAAQARFLDISDGGCRLQIEWEGIQTGDIVAIHWGRADWRIGSLTWISRDGDTWDCGVQWLLDQPQAAMVSFDGSAPAVALLGRCHADGERGLIFGSATRTDHRQCRVNASQQWQGYSLALVKSTGLVELATLSAEPHAEAEPAVRQAEQQSRPAPSGGSEEDDAWAMFAPLGAAGHG